jgi:hypothetical protein
MAVLALATVSPTDQDPIAKGTAFLLREKDRYGVWYSGQTTINVLKALLAVLHNGTGTQVASKITLYVNGTAVTTVDNAASILDAPTLVDVTSFVKPGENRIAVSGWGADDIVTSSLQAVASYYIPWAESAKSDESIRTGKADALALAVHYDRTEAKVGDEIHCHVSATRIGSRGYGMMLAEIGLPPGAEVDRASLDDTVLNSRWTVSHYDVLPDRLVLYLWPSGGGSQVDFTLRPRYGLRARSAASVLYDYYNPEARVVLAPTDFRIAGKGNQSTEVSMK